MDEDKFIDFTSNVRIRNLKRIVAACDIRYPDTVDWLKTDGEKIVYMALQHVHDIEHSEEISKAIRKYRI